MITRRGARRALGGVWAVFGLGFGVVAVELFRRDDKAATLLGLLCLIAGISFLAVMVMTVMPTSRDGDQD